MKDLKLLLNFLGNKPFVQIKEELSQKPYCLKFDETGTLYLLKYDQIESDMSNSIVQFCRGIILEKETNKPVCIPFYKFFNHGETNADDIDWESARVQEKIDGSIIKVFYYGDIWRIATNGKIDSFDCPVNGFDNLTFAKIFRDAYLNQSVRFYSNLNEKCTYIFELVSPYNRVVVNYPETKIYHIGTRNNETFEELDIDIGIEKPREYKLNSIDDCIKVCVMMKEDQEGFVVVDKYWNRIKVKSPLYLQLHHAVNNGKVTKARLIEMIKDNTIDDFIGVFPEWKKDYEEIKTKLNQLIGAILIINANKDNLNLSKKDFALKFKDRNYSSILFSLYDKKFKIEDLTEYILNQNINWLEKIL